MKNIKKNTKRIFKNIKKILVKTFLCYMILSIEYMNCVSEDLINKYLEYHINHSNFDTDNFILE